MSDNGEQLGNPTQRKLSFARQLGGYFLGRLPELESPPEISAKKRAVDSENAVIDQRQQAHFHANLLRVVGPSTAENMARLNAIKELFETELDGAETIADRFNLFREPFYAPFMNTLDLGETKKPDSHEEVATLKQEYHELLEQLVGEKHIKGELTRREAKPSIHLSVGNTSGEYVSATRNREHFSFTDDSRTLSVAKRMTFLMPSDALETLSVPTHGRLEVPDVKKIEKLIDAQDVDKIIPVRTVYYAKIKPVNKSKE